MSADPSAGWLIAADIAQIAAPIAAWAAVVYQANRITRDNKSLEARRECRILVDDTIKSVDFITAAARKYHTSPPSSEDKATEFLLIRNTHHLGSRLLTLSAISLKFMVTKEHIAFRKSVTLENFETSERIATMPNDPLVLTIQDSAMKLTEALESAYVAVYSKPA